MRPIQSSWSAPTHGDATNRGEGVADAACARRVVIDRAVTHLLHLENDQQPTAGHAAKRD